jgi:hypothetical protein
MMTRLKRLGITVFIETIVLDWHDVLRDLLEKKLIIQVGRGRSVKYIMHD